MATVNAYVNAVYPPQAADPVKGTKERKNYKVIANIGGQEKHLLLNRNKVDEISVTQGFEYVLDVSQDSYGNTWINSAQGAQGEIGAPPVTQTTSNTPQTHDKPPAYAVEKDARITAGMALNCASRRLPAGSTMDEVLASAREFMLAHEQLTEEWVRHLSKEQEAAQAPADESDIPF